MFYTYIIKSIKFDSFYTGHSQDLNERLLKHNGSYSKSTKAKAPWKLVYFEEFETRSRAAKREIEIKNKKSRKYIEELLADFDIEKKLGL